MESRNVGTDESKARVLAEKLLRASGDRLAHSKGVAMRVDRLAGLFSDADLSLLKTAAHLHDIGYSSALVHTGLHSLDGALFLREHTEIGERVVNLVAHHSYARLEAEERGLADQLNSFPMEGEELVDGLIYCDMSTSPIGDEVDPAARIAEIVARYGPDTVVGRFIERARLLLLTSCDRVEARLTAAQPM